MPNRTASPGVHEAWGSNSHIVRLTRRPDGHGRRLQRTEPGTAAPTGGRVLPFRIHWGRGSSQIITGTPPPLVPLAPGGIAYFAAGKFRAPGRQGETTS